MGYDPDPYSFVRQPVCRFSLFIIPTLTVCIQSWTTCLHLGHACPMTATVTSSHHPTNSAKYCRRRARQSVALRLSGRWGCLKSFRVTIPYVPLEPTGPGVSRRKLCNWNSTVYRAIRASDGTPHALREGRESVLVPSSIAKRSISVAPDF